MGSGHTRIAPGKQAGKDGGRPKLKNVWLADLRITLVENLSHYFPVGNTDIGYAKNWKGNAFSRLTRGHANEALPIWHSCIFGPFWRMSPYNFRNKFGCCVYNIAGKTFMEIC